MATPSQERNIELARDGLRIWMTGDVAGAMARVSEEVEVFVPTDLGNPAQVRGREALLEWTRRWDDAWEEFTYEMDDATPVGDGHVVAIVRTTGRGRGSGIEVEDSRGWVFGIRDGLLDYLSLQPSFDDALELARNRETGLAGADAPERQSQP
jgi:ketosteroid isomerase-like protein